MAASMRVPVVVEGRVVEMTAEEETAYRASNACVPMKTVKALTSLLIAKGLITQAEVDAALTSQASTISKG